MLSLIPLLYEYVDCWHLPLIPWCSFLVLPPFLFSLILVKWTTCNLVRLELGLVGSSSRLHTGKLKLALYFLFYFDVHHGIKLLTFCLACKKQLLQLFYRRTSHLRKYLRIWDAAVGGSLPSRHSNACKYLVPTSSKRRRSVFSSLFAHLLTIGKDFVLLDYRVKLSHFPVLLQISHSLGLLRAAGEQISQVSRVHVESTVVGHGGCSYHGHRTG